MWTIDNQTPFEAERAFVRDCDGVEVWLVAVRATFLFDAHGQLTIAPEQQKVCTAPVFFDDPGCSSLQYESDLQRTKLGTDIILNASAHAPSDKPVSFVDAGWTVGPLNKGLRVFGDRIWERRVGGLCPSAPLPFRTMPIRYERAWGGPLPQGIGRSPENPAGMGRDALPGKPVPNCTFIDDPIATPRYEGRPAGFGPIACHWRPRVSLAGTYDDNWKQTRLPLVPADFQNAYFQCAPADQQVAGFLTGGERVLLKNLTPEGLVSFHLPRIALGFRTEIGGRVVHHERALHSVIIEPDERRLVMVWHTALSCHHTLYTLKRTIVFQKRNLSWRGADSIHTMVSDAV
ncbi:MAG: DUF2169 domain-containing protein [Polyangiaceae bacterium]|nr:DUF2169 domain-containing protein [Polyangiaceae bacterium]